MSRRLASFRGPSTPSPTPVQKKQPNLSNTPTRPTESTYHRKIRTHLQELRAITEIWNDLVLLDGLKAAKDLVDTRTDLENEVSLLPNKLPRSRLVSPKLAVMEKYIAELDLVINKLQKQFRRMNLVIESMETLLIEAHQAKGWRWVQEPLWVTWSLEKFVTSAPSLLSPYYRSLNLHVELVDTLRRHSVSFGESRCIISKWVEQPWLEDAGWDAVWEDICDIEVERW